MTIETDFTPLARPVTFNAFEQQPGRLAPLLFGRLNGRRPVSNSPVLSAHKRCGSITI